MVKVTASPSVPPPTTVEDLKIGTVFRLEGGRPLELYLRGYDSAIQLTDSDGHSHPCALRDTAAGQFRTAAYPFNKRGAIAVGTLSFNS